MERPAHIAETETASDGRFEIPCRPGVWIEVRARGFVKTKTRPECRDGNDVVLSPGIAIDGIVVRAGTRAPIEGARVVCTWPSNMQPFEEMTTDEKGAFSLSSCVPGPIELYVEREGFASEWKLIGAQAVTEAVRGVVVELRDGRRLTGTVVDASGRPVPAADVVVLEQESSDRTTMVTTDANGKFETTISLERYLVGAVVTDGRVAQMRIAAGPDAPKPIEIRLPNWTAVLRGRLVGDVKGAEVRAFRDGYAEDDAVAIRENVWPQFGRFSFFRRATVTGDRFEIAGVEPGEYRLSATSETGRGEATAMHDEPDIVIKLASSARIAMRISWDDGTPASGLLKLSYDDGSVNLGVNDGVLKGSPPLPPGEFTANFYPTEGNVVPVPTVLDVKPGTNDLTWTLSRQSFEIRGRVVDAMSGRGLSDVHVTLAREHGDEATVVDEEGRVVKTGANGEFAMTVASLDSELFFLREGYASLVVTANAASLVKMTPGESKPYIRKNRPAPTSAKKSGPLTLR